MNRLIGPALFLITVFHGICASSQDPFVRQFIDARTSDGAGRAADRIFRSEEAMHISPLDLVGGNDHSIALQSEWRLHHRLSPRKGAYLGILPVVSHLPDIQRFVGFVEGRLRVQVPEWWEDMLYSPNVHHPARTGAATEEWLTFPDDPNEIDSLTTKVLCGAVLAGGRELWRPLCHKQLECGK